MTRYSRQDAVRILQLPLRDLKAWEVAGLVAAREHYSFDELGQLRTLRELRRRRISTTRIRAAMEAMQRVSGMRTALLVASAERGGRRMHFRCDGALLEPFTQQMAFDFDAFAERRLETVPPLAEERRQRRAIELQQMFLRAVRLEEDAATVAEAMQLYESILERDPAHAPSLINLGTIRYNQRAYATAETMYRRATEVDPRYALAFFDLGNVLDEMQRVAEATAAYERAVELVPTYADAHYNLALAYERQGKRRRALRHWLTYVRLDPVGPWSAHARGQARRTLKAEKLSIVSRRGRLVQAG